MFLKGLYSAFYWNIKVYTDCSPEPPNKECNGVGGSVVIKYTAGGCCNALTGINVRFM